MMKKCKFVLCLITLIFFALAGISCEQSGAAKSGELRGAIHADSDGLYVISGGKRYYIESQQDMTALKGKMVNLEGTLAEKEGRYTIVVNSVKE